MTRFDGSNLEDVAARLHVLGKNIHAATKKALPVVKRGSDEWLAWRQWRRDNGLSVGFMERQDIWTVPTIYPPANLAELEREWQERAKTGLKKSTREALGV